MTMSQEVYNLVNSTFPEHRSKWVIDTKKRKACIEFEHRLGKVRIEVNGFQNTMSLVIANEKFFWQAVTADKETAMECLGILYLPDLKKALAVKINTKHYNPTGLNN